MDGSVAADGDVASCGATLPAEPVWASPAAAQNRTMLSSMSLGAA